jgi:outer membrane protein
LLQKKKVLAVILLPLFMLAAVDVAAELKVVILDVQRAINESEEAKKLTEALRQDLAKDEENLNQLGEDIKTLRAKLEKDSEIMGEAEKRKIAKGIEDKGIDYEFGVNKFRKESQDGMQEIFQAMAPKLDAVMKDLIELEGYDVVFQRSGLLYVNTKHEITRKVTEKLNEKQ